MPAINDHVQRNDQRPIAGGRPGRQTMRLRAAFLVPVAVVIVAIMALLVAQLFLHERVEIEHEVGRVRTVLDRMYLDDLTHNRAMLHAVMEVIQLDPALHRALARKDRTELLARTASVLPRLREKFHITQFYFSGPDRVNLLRVHQPGRHGDVIDRYTMLEAERTGIMARGVELDPFGVLTLRMVHPWYLAPAQRPIGYFELSMEIDHILRAVQDFLGVPVVVLVSKQYLERAPWEAGTRALGHTPEWDRFPATVLNYQATHTLPPAVAAALAGFPAPAPDAVFEVAQGRESYRLTATPLRDAADRTVGWMVAVIDVSRHVETVRRVVWLGAGIALAGAGVLFALFWWLVGRIGRRIERDEQALHDFAIRDRLTGAWNRRRFDELLAQEMKRAHRYDLPLSLIMFDIDHFKKVNDTRGHQAGDDLLAVLSVYVSVNVRDTDLLARWGGEEFMVIAPNTDVEAAWQLAEKLRVRIERGNFGESGQITCSFGVTQFRSGDTAEDFTGRADTAMYAAKQSGRNRVVRYEDSMKAAGASA